jgi:HSP20 family protein
MLMRTDPFRSGDEYVVAFDLPGVAPDVIELDIERNVLTVKAVPRKITITGADSHQQIRA